jgi:hypothetical protein
VIAAPGWIAGALIWRVGAAAHKAKARKACQTRNILIEAAFRAF